MAKSWKYRTEEFASLDSPEAAALLADLGTQGWEAAAAQPRGESVVLLLKRPTDDLPGFVPRLRVGRKKSAGAAG